MWVSLAALISPYFGMLTLALVGETSDSWTFRFACLPFVAALQNHLQILFHEGAHYQLVPKKRLNDIATNIFCGVPFFGLVSQYRYFHFQHHRHLKDPKLDPEVSFYEDQGYRFEPLPLEKLLKIIFLDLCGYHFFQFFFSYQLYLAREIQERRLPQISKGEWTSIAVVAIGVGILLTMPHGGRIFLWYWILPQVTFLFFFLKLQGYGEHRARSGKIDEFTSDLETGKITRFFIYPYNSDRHLTHHLYPNVPWYRLRSLGRNPEKRNYLIGKHSVLRETLLRP